MCAGSEIKVAILRFDLPCRRIFPRWTSSGSAAAALSRSANGNRLRRRQKGARCSIGKTKQEQARKRRKDRDRGDGERVSTEIRITGTATRPEMRSQARGERRKEATKERHPGLAEGFKAILRGASEGTEGSHVTTVEQFTQDGLLRFYEDMDDRAAFATLHA